MRQDINKDKILLGGERVNISVLARQYNCCLETIDKRLNPEKYFKPKKMRKYFYMLNDYKSIIDKKLEDNSVPATGILSLLKNKYGYKGGYGIIRKYVSEKKKKTNIVGRKYKIRTKIWILNQIVGKLMVYLFLVFYFLFLSQKLSAFIITTLYQKNDCEK